MSENIYEGFSMFNDTFGYMVIVKHKGREGVVVDAILANPQEWDDWSIKACQVVFFDEPLRLGLKFSEGTTMDIPVEELQRIGAIHDDRGAVYEQDT